MKTHQEINQLFEKSMDSAGSDPASSYAIAENLLSTCKQTMIYQVWPSHIYY